jgi:hypothetical protein
MSPKDTTKPLDLKRLVPLSGTSSSPFLKNSALRPVRE